MYKSLIYTKNNLHKLPQNKNIQMHETRRGNQLKIKQYKHSTTQKNMNLWLLNYIENQVRHLEKKQYNKTICKYLLEQILNTIKDLFIIKL